MTSNGVLLVAKPRGPTSHDVVAKLRRMLGTKRIGHAGTLDPMASGLLVMLVGEGTKLEPYFASADKRYVAGVAFGRSTSTLDAEGDITAEGEVPSAVRAALARVARDRGDVSSPLREALDAELARAEQVPPSFSAIRVDGERAHRRARAGLPVELAPRPVRVGSIDVRDASDDPARLVVELCVSKGYYVRSFARDLGEHVGCPSHLDALERTRSGSFDLADAVDLERGVVEGSLLSLAQAASKVFVALRLTEEQARLVGMGRGLDPARVDGAAEIAVGARVAMLDERAERLLAVAERRTDELAVLRGFHDS